MQDGEESSQRAHNVDRQLHYVGPDHGCHAALQGVNQREHADDCDGGNVAAKVAESAQQVAESDADHDSDGEDAHAFGGCAGDQEQARCKRTKFLSEAALDQLVGRDQVAAEVVRDQQNTDDDAPDQVADDKLQEAEVALVGQAGNADDGERAGLGGHDGERNRPPGNRLLGQEISAEGARLLPESHAKESDPGQIHGDHGHIQRVQSHEGFALL